MDEMGLAEVGPVVGTEGTNGEAGGGDEVRGGVVSPGIAHGNGSRHFGCFDDDALHEAFAFGVCLGDVPFVVGSGDGEALDVGVVGQGFATPGATEGEDGMRRFDAHLVVFGCCAGLRLAIGAVQGE